jgi:hypothetical protein
VKALLISLVYLAAIAESTHDGAGSDTTIEDEYQTNESELFAPSPPLSPKPFQNESPDVTILEQLSTPVPPVEKVQNVNHEKSSEWESAPVSPTPGKIGEKVIDWDSEDDIPDSDDIPLSQIVLQEIQKQRMERPKSGYFLKDFSNSPHIYTECVLAFGVFPGEIETPLKLTNQVVL